MAFDAKDKLWEGTYITYYDSYYEELVADTIIRRWQTLDEITKVLVALTASGSALSGWALWSDEGFKIIWVILAGLGAFIAIVHSAFGVSARLKDWGEIKRWFAILRIDLETFRYRMEFNPKFSVDELDKKFIVYRERYGDGVQRLKADIVRTRALEGNAQLELNKRLAENKVIEQI